ncbi:MAG: hypothetical protein K2X94_01920 [Amoebophilaceae bacterium]|nr:hypothetical protein [Amoebophilaceae bacterium]
MNLFVHLIGNKSMKFTHAPSILGDQDVHATIKAFITDPIATIKECKNIELQTT